MLNNHKIGKPGKKICRPFPFVVFLLKIAKDFMGDPGKLVSGIELKVRKLAGLLEQREIQSRQWNDERERHLAMIREQQARIVQLEEKVKTLQMANALTTKEDAASVRLRINELVREVDRCIAMLNE
jgi:hypothetical protein